VEKSIVNMMPRFVWIIFVAILATVELYQLGIIESVATSIAAKSSDLLFLSMPFLFMVVLIGVYKMWIMIRNWYHKKSRRMAMMKKVS